MPLPSNEISRGRKAVSSQVIVTAILQGGLRNGISYNADHAQIRRVPIIGQPGRIAIISLGQDLVINSVCESGN